jgi:hypothetical protein
MPFMTPVGGDVFMQSPAVAPEGHHASRLCQRNNQGNPGQPLCWSRTRRVCGLANMGATWLSPDDVRYEYEDRLRSPMTNAAQPRPAGQTGHRRRLSAGEIPGRGGAGPSHRPDWWHERRSQALVLGRHYSCCLSRRVHAVRSAGAERRSPSPTPGSKQVKLKTQAVGVFCGESPVSANTSVKPPPPLLPRRKGMSAGLIRRDRVQAGRLVSVLLIGARWRGSRRVEVSLHKNARWYELTFVEGTTAGPLFHHHCCPYLAGTCCGPSGRLATRPWRRGRRRRFGRGKSAKIPRSYRDGKAR